jgi:sigma-B regulation protein RsbU (phosphoserine phosphatase)
MVADAVGKGVQAAVMTANFKGIEEALISEKNSPKDVIEKLNIAIHENPLYDNCLPVFYGVLDPINHTFTYSNGGNDPGLHFSQSTFKDLTTGGPPLGMTLDTSFEEDTIQLEDTAILLFFTDGLTEAKNIQHEFFGIKRVKNAIQNYHDKAIGNQTFSNYLTETWNTFRNPTDKDADDFTMVMVEFQKVKIVKERIRH